MNYSLQYSEAARYMAETGCTFTSHAIQRTAGSRIAEDMIDYMWETYCDTITHETVANLTPEEKILWLLFLSEAEKERA